MTASHADGGRAGESPARLEVAAGILRDDGGRVLVAERRGDAAFRGLWEFPGGKIDAGESPEQAVRRELREELDIEVARSRHWLTVEHDYPQRRVRLYFFLIDDWRGEPRGAVGQQLRWTAIDALEAAVLLPANAPVVAALQQMLN